MPTDLRHRLCVGSVQGRLAKRDSTVDTTVEDDGSECAHGNRGLEKSLRHMVLPAYGSGKYLVPGSGKYLVGFRKVPSPVPAKYLLHSASVIPKRGWYYRKERTAPMISARDCSPVADSRCFSSFHRSSAIRAAVRALADKTESAASMLWKGSAP